MRHKTAIHGIFFAALMLASPAQTAPQGGYSIGDGYAVPNYPELTQTYMMLGGQKVDDTAAIDEYIRIVYCPVYLEKFSDDFVWNEVRRTMQADIQEKREQHRELYEVVGTASLGRYDFEKKTFPLVNGTAMRNVGSLAVISLGQATGWTCGSTNSMLNRFPYAYNFVLDMPLNVRELRMEPEAAVTLVESLGQRDRGDFEKMQKREVFVRLRVRVTEIAPKDATVGGRTIEGGMLGRVQAIDFFADRELAFHIGGVSLSQPPR